jgi:DNA-binding MarR family transcriptional regulator
MTMTKRSAEQHTLIMSGSRLRILTVLIYAKRPLWVREIAEQSGVTQESVNDSMHLFVQHGWVERIRAGKPYPGTAAYNQYALTSDGRDRAEDEIETRTNR